MRAKVIWFPLKVQASANGELSEIQPPPMIASIRSATPMAETSSTRPGLMKRRYMPMRIAMGSVIAMENARHLPERLTVPPQGEEERRHVLHRAGEDDADDDPDRPRQEAHLGRQDWPDERPRSRYGREVVPEEHPPIHRLEVPAVV